MDCEMNWSVTVKEDSVFINSQNKHDYVRLLMFIIHFNNLQARLVLIPKQLNRWRLISDKDDTRHRSANNTTIAAYQLDFRGTLSWGKQRVGV